MLRVRQRNLLYTEPPGFRHRNIRIIYLRVIPPKSLQGIFANHGPANGWIADKILHFGILAACRPTRTHTGDDLSLQPLHYTVNFFDPHGKGLLLFLILQILLQDGGFRATKLLLRQCFIASAKPALQTGQY